MNKRGGKLRIAKTKRNVWYVIGEDRKRKIKEKYVLGSVRGCKVRNLNQKKRRTILIWRVIAWKLRILKQLKPDRYVIWSKGLKNDEKITYLVKEKAMQVRKK